jgi:hypothetical protein
MVFVFLDSQQMKQIYSNNRFKCGRGKLQFAIKKKILGEPLAGSFFSIREWGPEPDLNQVLGK